MKTGIPKQFQLAGHTVKVRIVPPSKWRYGKGVLGVFRPARYTIDIISTQKGTAREQTFWHEYIHALLTVAGHEDLSTDEGLVDRLGHLQHQAMTTLA